MNPNAQMWAMMLCGQQLGGYRLGEPLGTGWFSVVFDAEHISTGARVAVKVLLPITSDGQDALDFAQEGRLLKKAVKCSNVITLIETARESLTITTNGLQIPVELPYHVLSRASGALDELLEDPVVRSQMQWTERIDLWRGIVLGIHQLHLKGVAHRDLKASNCLLMVSDATTQIRLADLGRGRALDVPPRLPPGAYVQGRGDLAFAPPEFLWAQGTDSVEGCRAADLYGLGSMLFELGTGQPITSAAVGSVEAAMVVGQQDLAAGYARDLATLRPRYRLVLADLADALPPVIRHQVLELVTRLCDPVPAERFPKTVPGRKRPPDDGLLWLLRRTDIVGRRLAAEWRRTSSQQDRNRSA